MLNYFHKQSAARARRCLLALCCLLAAVQAEAGDQLDLDLQVEVTRDTPELVFDTTPPVVTLKTDGTATDLNLCLFDGTGGNGSPVSPAGNLQISFTDSNTSTDGARSSNTVFSIGLNGSASAGSGQRLDYLLVANTPGWTSFGPFSRGVVASIDKTQYPAHTVAHAATTATPYPFQCLPFNLTFKPTNDGATGPVIPVSAPGNYSGQLNITLTAPN